MKVVFKIFISLVLLYFVLNQIDLKKVIDLIQRIDIFYFLLAFVFYNLSKIVSAIRLNYFFKEIELNISNILNLKLYYMGMFYNLFLPGGIGGDGYKAYLLKKYYKKNLSTILKAVLFDRISGLIGLVFLASFLFLFTKFSIIPLNVLAFLILILLYPILFYISKRFNLFFKYFKITNLLGLCVQVLQVISAFFLLISLKQNLAIVEYLVLFLISSVLSVLPITIGGVGIREATFFYGLSFLDQEVSSAIAFSFLFFLITALSSFIGVFYLNNKYLLKNK